MSIFEFLMILLSIFVGLTVVVGTSFRPIAFDALLWRIDNFSAIPTIAVVVLLATVRSRRLHQVLVPLVFLFVLLDTLTISYSIG